LRAAGRVVNANTLRYTCMATPGGLAVRGVIGVAPYPNGYKLLEVILPPDETQITDQVLSALST
jgi:hypothetical protein